MSWYSSSSFIDTPPCAQFQRLEQSSTKYHLSTVRWRGGCKKCGSVTISLLAMNVTGLSTFPPAPRPPLPPHNECQSTRRWWRWRYDGLQLQTSEKCSSAPDSNFLYSTGQPTAAQHSRRLVTAALHCYCIFVARSSLNDATLSCFSSSATTDCRAKLQSNDNNNDRIAAVVMLPEIRHFNLFPCCFGNLTFCLEFLKCENSNSKILNVSKTWWL